MIKVAIIEDQEDMRNGLESLLNETADLACQAAFPNAEEALKHIPTLQPDVVICDIGLPRMNGIECVAHLKNLCPNTNFLMLTVFDSDDKVFEALKAGANGYILKREPSHKILEAIRDIHEGGAPMSSLIARKVMQSFQLAVIKKKEVIETNISSRELEILDMLSQGFLNKEIADKLFIAVGTVKQHIYKIYKKLHVQNRVEAVNKYKHL